MAYAAKEYGHLVGMEGFGETLLKNHFTLYQGYVTNTNKVADALAAMAADGKAATPEFAELKRRFGWEWNGMRLHELYFGNLGGKAPLSAHSGGSGRPSPPPSAAWTSGGQFRATGAMRGIGWVVLYQDAETGPSSTSG